VVNRAIGRFPLRLGTPVWFRQYQLREAQQLSEVDAARHFARNRSSQIGRGQKRIGMLCGKEGDPLQHKGAPGDFLDAAAAD